MNPFTQKPRGASRLKGTQEIIDAEQLPDGSLELKLWHGYNIILNSQDVLELRDYLSQFCPPPKVNIQCETKSDSVIGSTSLNVIRVEQEDDGSYTAVTDHWPRP